MLNLASNVKVKIKFFRNIYVCMIVNMNDLIEDNVKIAHFVFVKSGFNVNET